jgi:hypothetical protein
MKKLKEAIASLQDAMTTEFALNRLVAPNLDTIELKEKKQSLSGGLADKLSLDDIAKKHKVKITDLKHQLNLGMKTEMEHTDNKKKAKEIAMDHLVEDPKYYEKLKKIEAKEKWSQKYKDSIDCKNPKGFSQKAHCQGKKKENKEATGSGSAGGYEAPLFSKMETKEATGASSSGSYETPKMWAKSLGKKDWRGKSKTQIPGGKFVQVKKKCKTFPYCNQGDINALKIFENKLLKKVITNISKNDNISEDTIKKILLDYISSNK